jgi:hypothetical protein
MSTSTVDAAPASSDAAMNTVTPTTNIFRRPKRSPSAAPVKSMQARVRLYPLTVHSRLPRLLCKEWRSVGSAVVTTSASRNAIIKASEAATRVQVGFQAGRRSANCAVMAASIPLVCPVTNGGRRDGQCPWLEVPFVSRANPRKENP